MNSAELLRLLKDAEESSPELDFWITVRVWDPHNYESGFTDEDLQHDIDLVGIEGMYIEKPFTSSIDAAIALCEKVLPGYGWDVASNTSHIKACLNPEFGKPIGKYPHWAFVSDTSSSKFEDGANPAIALCIAVLKAKLAIEGKANGKK